MEILLAVGIGVGLASVAGLRAFLPLGLAGAFVLLGFFVLPPPFEVLELPSVTAVVFALAALEIILDKMKVLERAFNYAMIPIRAASGGDIVRRAHRFDLDMGSVSWLIVGAVIAAAAAVLKVLLRPSARVESSGVSARFLSAVEDAAAFVGGLAGLFVPLLPVVLVAFVLFFYYRVRKRRGRKYEGLRILGD